MIGYGEKQFAETMDEKKGLDEKAASIITYLSGGVGAATLGAIFAVASNPAAAGPARWLLPSLVLALAAVGLALRARRVVEFWGLPPVGQAKAHAEFYGTEKESKAALIDVWERIYRHNQPILARKAWYVNRAIDAYYLSVLALLFPFVRAAWGG